MVSGSDHGISGRDLVSGLECALAQVRVRAPEHRRWCVEQGAGTGATPPWSDEDEQQAAELGSVDPWWMRSVADELARAHSELRDLGAELARMAGSAIGSGATARCASLAATSHERATEAATLASGARSAGERADELLDDVVRRLTDAQSQGAPSAGLPWPEPSGSRSDGDSDGSGSSYFEGYEVVLRAVRAELSSALEVLPTLVGLHQADPAERGGWAPQAGTDRWSSEPGTGPQLPGTAADRVETDIGVRIARLPDGPRR